MKVRFSILLFLILPLIGCEKEPPTPEELYNKYRKSVVLIKSDYYHKIKLEEDINFYFTRNGNEIQLYQDEEIAFQNADISFGTGFIIDGQGKIATNRHVVYPEVEKDLIFRKLDTYFQEMRNNISEDIQANNDTLQALKSYYNDYYNELTYLEQKNLEDRYANIQERNSLYEDLIGLFHYDKENVQIELVRKKLGIAYDDTFIENSDDFYDCVAIRKSENEEIDLAIIQLKNKMTPGYITDFFLLPEINRIKKVQLNDAVFMIGYNHGVDLAITKDGIKSQFTTGNVSQDPDNQRILYSVPTLPGSSGSPVINEWGELVAVNYAKTSDFQGFSFGVPVSNLVQLYQDIPLPEMNSNANELLVSQGNDSKTYEIDFTSKIESLLRAEEVRDIESVISFYSENMKRYWDNNYPTRANLYEQYQNSWEMVRSSENRDIYIERINNYNYNLHTTFEFVLNKTGEFKSVRSKVRYKFDEDGKIIEIYGLN